MQVRRFDFPDFKVTRTAIDDIFKNLPVWAGNAALNFYRDSWRRQGYIDRSFVRWPQRSNTQSGKAVLVQSGRLRRSLRLSTGATWFEVSTDVPYAKAHNEGETITQTVTAKQRGYFWARHKAAKDAGRSGEADRWKRMALSKTLTITMPKRQFMGESDLLRRRIVAQVERGLAHATR